MLHIRLETRCCGLRRRARRRERDRVRELQSSRTTGQRVWSVEESVHGWRKGQHASTRYRSWGDEAAETGSQPWQNSSPREQRDVPCKTKCSSSPDD
eukprot:3131018-Pleurochrysis_carterae.AAC.1